MAENKLVKGQHQHVVPRSPSSRLFAPMVPFGDLFGMNPFALMREFTREMDRTFGDVATGDMQSGAWAPTIEVTERDGSLVVTADLPGIKPEDVNVEINGDVLTIQGERHDEKKEEKDNCYRSERSYGQFYRAIPLPEGTKAEQVRADLNKGVLQINVPLPEGKQKSKKISVTASEGAQDKEKKTAAA